MLVYWIHYKDHDDPYTEGYIGVTNNLENRIYQHTSKHSKCHHVKNRIENGAVFTVLHHVDSIDDALKLEMKYRPDDNIGWNICKGGGYPPKVLSEWLDTNKLKGDDRTEAQKAASKAHSERMSGRSAWNKGKTGIQEAWNKGKVFEAGKKQAGIESVCPKCGKKGKGNSMKRWHFDNCRSSK